MEIDKLHLSKNIKLALPVMVTQLGHPLVGLSASIILGLFGGTSALASLAIANGYFNLLLIIAIGISYGITPLVSNALGKGNKKFCGVLLLHSLLLNLLVGLLLFFLSLIGCFLILPNIGQKVSLVNQAAPLLLILGFSLLPLMIFLTFKQFAEGVGLTKQAMQISLVGNLINIVLGIILISGKFGITSFGIMAVGYAALADRIVMMIAMGIFVFRNDQTKLLLKHFTLKKFKAGPLSLLLKTGIPITLQHIFEISAFSAAVFITGWLGEKPLAAYQSAMIMVSMIYYAAGGFGTSAAINTAFFRGRNDFKSLRSSAASNYQLVIIFHLITGIFLFLFREPLTHFFSKDETVIIMIGWLLCGAAAMEVFDGLQIVGLGILRGLADNKYPTLISMIAYWFFGLPIAYTLGVHTRFGIYGIWAGLYSGLAIATAGLYWRYKYLTNNTN